MLDKFFREAPAQDTDLFEIIDIENFDPLAIRAHTCQKIAILADCEILDASLHVSLKYLLLDARIQWLLYYDVSFLPRWDCENKICFTHAQSNNRLLRLKCLNLPYNREFRETVDVDTALLQNDDALFAHPYALNFSIKVELFELLHLLVVPHDDFCFGPLGVLASADECHYVLFVEHFNLAYAAVELPGQL